MKTCRTCGRAVAKSAKRCPGCGAKLTMALWKKIGIAVLVLALLSAIGSRTGGSRTRTPSGPVDDVRTEPSGQAPLQAGDQGAVDAPVDSGEAGVPIGEPDVPSDPGTGDLGDYHVEIKGAVLTEDYKGNPAIVITYNWTNNSGKTTSAMVALDGDAFQGGIGLETAIIGNPDVHDGNAYMTEIRPGASLDVSLAYVLKDTTSIVEFELSQLISLSKDVVSMDFDPSILQAG